MRENKSHNKLLKHIVTCTIVSVIKLPGEEEGEGERSRRGWHRLY